MDAATPGFTRGRLLDKVGQRAQDTAELFFQDVLVPDADLLGEPGQGFGYMMKELARERLMIAARCAMALESALQWTVDYARQRQAFGKALLDNQYIRFKLADIKTLAAATRAFVDGCVRQYLDGELDAAGAAMASCGRPRPPAPSTICCSSTAATATCANTRSAGRTRTSGRTASTGAPRRSCAS